MVQTGTSIFEYLSGMGAPGVKMLGMGDSSLFKEIGFENGDILEAVNGEKMDSANKSLALYEALKSKSRLTVLIERDGIAKTLRYTIQ